MYVRVCVCSGFYTERTGLSKIAVGKTLFWGPHGSRMYELGDGLSYSSKSGLSPAANPDEQDKWLGKSPWSLAIPSVPNSTAVVLDVCREAPGGRKLNHSPGSLEFIAQDSQDVAELSVAICQSGSGRCRRNSDQPRGS